MSITLNGTTGITTPAIDNQGNLTVDGGTIKLDGNYPVGTNNVALGDTALDSNVSGGSNTAIGASVLTANTASYNTAIGTEALYSNTTGANNTANGVQSLYSNTTGIDNTAVGYQAGYSNTTDSYSTYLGDHAGYAATNWKNTFLGHASGEAVTTGAANTILGRYDGNQGGLDIRTSNNNIVLSDGDGNPRLHINSDGKAQITHASNEPALQLNCTNASFTTGSLVVYTSRTTTNSSYNHFSCYNGNFTGQFIIRDSGNAVNTNNSYGAVSDIKLKENIVDSGSQWDDIKALRVRKYSMKADNLNEPNRLGVIAQELEASGMQGLVSESIDRDEKGNNLGTFTKEVAYSVLYMKAVKALQEAMDRIETLEAQNASFEARITALEGA